LGYPGGGSYHVYIGTVSVVADTVKPQFAKVIAVQALGPDIAVKSMRGIGKDLPLERHGMTGILLLSSMDHGQSGGPVVDSEMRIIGVAQGRVEGDGKLQSIIRELVALVEEWHSKENNTNMPEMKDIGHAVAVDIIRERILSEVPEIARRIGLAAEVSQGLPATQTAEAALSGEMAIGQLLAAGGADTNGTSAPWGAEQYGGTPLQAAAARDNMVGLLLDQGLDINARGFEGETALYRAVRAGNTDVAKLLLNRSADANVKANDGTTPLHQAALSGYTKLAEILLAKGANVNARANNGSTPLDSAAVYGMKDVAELLLAHGATQTRGTTTVERP